MSTNLAMLNNSLRVNNRAGIVKALRKFPATYIVRARRSTQVRIGRGLGLGKIGAVIFALILANAGSIVNGTPLTAQDKQTQGMILSHAAAGVPIPSSMVNTVNTSATTHSALNFASTNVSQTSSRLLKRMASQAEQIMATSCSWVITPEERASARGLFGVGVNKLTQERETFCASETAVALAPIKKTMEEVSRTFVAVQTVQMDELQKAQLAMAKQAANAANKRAKNAQNALIEMEKSRNATRRELALAQTKLEVAQQAAVNSGRVLSRAKASLAAVAGAPAAVSEYMGNMGIILAVAFACAVFAFSAYFKVPHKIHDFIRYIRKSGRQDAAEAAEAARKLAEQLEKKIMVNAGTSPRTLNRTNAGTSPRRSLNRTNAGTSPRRSPNRTNAGTSPRRSPLRATRSAGTSPRRSPLRATRSV